MNPLLKKRQGKATPAERIAAYDQESWKAILEANAKDGKRSIAFLKEYIAAIERAPNVGGSDGLAPLTGSARNRLEFALVGMDEIVKRYRDAHMKNRERVEAEDLAVEQARAAAAAAEALAVSEKERRLQRAKELKALQEEFPDVFEGEAE